MTCKLEEHISLAAKYLKAQELERVHAELFAAEQEAVLMAPHMVSTLRAHRMVLAAEGAEFVLPTEDLLVMVALTKPRSRSNDRVMVDQPQRPCAKNLTPEQLAERMAARQVLRENAAPTLSPEEVRERRARRMEKIQAQRKALRILEGVEVELPPEQDPHETPLLILLTTLADFDQGYSLVTVILDQARAGVLAGYMVQVVGMENLAPVHPQIPGVTFVPLLPRVIWREDQIQDEMVDRFRDIMQAHLIQVAGEHPEVVVVAHDLLLQSWFLTLAKAIHLIEPVEGVSWYHQVHSGVSRRPAPEIARWRAKLPLEHRIAAVNWADRDRLAAYYQTTPDRIVTLPNVRTAEGFFGFSGRLCDIVQRGGLHEADVVQIYPLSTPRALDKGILRVMDVFQVLKRDYGLRVRLVMANAHHAGNRKTLEMLTHEAHQRDLAQEFVITSQVANYGASLPPEDIRGLFQVSNVFCFPSVSESCGLVMLEAAMAGCLLVLNEDLPTSKDFVPPEGAIWVPWGSVTVQRLSGALQAATHQAAHDIVRALPHKANLSKRHILRHGIQTLAAALGALKGSSPAPANG